MAIVTSDYHLFTQVTEVFHVIWPEHIAARVFQLALSPRIARTVALYKTYWLRWFLSDTSLVELFMVANFGVLYLKNRVHRLTWEVRRSLFRFWQIHTDCCIGQLQDVVSLLRHGANPQPFRIRQQALSLVQPRQRQRYWTTRARNGDVTATTTTRPKWTCQKTRSSSSLARKLVLLDEDWSPPPVFVRQALQQL